MSNLYGNGDDQLVPFLRDLADSIESNNIHNEKLKIVGEFFMNYKLQEELIDKDSDKEYDDIDIIKFITLGWWIYQHILSNENNLTDSSELQTKDE